MHKQCNTRRMAGHPTHERPVGRVGYTGNLIMRNRFSVLMLALPLAYAQDAPQQPRATPAAPVQPGVAFVRENYSKYEYRIPMRDGVKLFTSIYVPKDIVSDAKSYPIMLSRTPYSVKPYGVDQFRGDLGPSDLFARD